MTPAESLARSIAVEAHAGQHDLAGEPYIGHVERVVARLDDALDRAVAWLHDVVEDTEWTLQDLIRSGRDHFPLGDSASLGDWQRVIGDVWALTHRKNEPRGDYYVRVVATSDRAVRVKLADIADNADPARLAVLHEDTRGRLVRKYETARRALTEEEQ